MRQLAMVLVFFMALGACTSADGSYALMYGLNINMSGVDVNDNNSGEIIPMKALLVMEFNEPNNELLDANLTVFGKGPFFWCRDQNDSKNFKKFFIQTERFDINDINDINDVNDINDANEFLNVTVTHNGKFVTFDISADSPYGFEMLLIGKEKPVNVGTVAPQNAAVVLKGVTWQFDGILFSGDENIVATGDVQASLIGGFVKKPWPCNPWGHVPCGKPYKTNKFNQFNKFKNK
jgi:hypothetical protein